MSRPSGLGSNSRKFTEVRLPDGKIFEVVKARSASTLICLVEDGGWPERGIVMLDYDMADAYPGRVLEIEEGRPGHGLGEIAAVRVLDIRLRIYRRGGNYGQVRRWVLAEPVPGFEIDDLNADALGGRP